MSETLRFDLLANDRASAVFDKVGKAAGDTESRFSKVGKGLATVGKVAATGLAVGVGAGAVALGKMVGEARESERVGKLTESIIKSTGGAAKVSAAQVGALATSISNKTGVDDEAIQSGSNLLLTFKNVRNEVGKGNKIFDEATQAAVDLSAAGFGSIEGSSKMLGKALNDPIAGISALGRAGVTFSEDQKAAIKAMVESGDVLGAQNAILTEVQSQVGGAAAATGTAMDKMKTSMGNLGETIGASLLPLVDKGAEVGAKFIGGLQAAFQSGGLGAALSYVGQQIGAMLPVIRAKLMEWGSAFVEWIGPRIPPMLAKLGELAQSLATWATGTALPWLAQALVRWGKAFVEWIGPMIPPALTALGAAAGRLFDWLLSTGLPRLLSNLRRWGEAFVKWIAPMIPPALAAPGGLLARLVGWILSEGLPKLAGALVRLGVELVQWIGPMIPKAIAALAVLGARLVGWVVSEGIPTLAAKMLTMGVRALEGLKDGAVNGFQAVLSWLGGLGGKIAAGVGSLAMTLFTAGTDLVRGMINGIRAMAGQVMAEARNLAANAVAAIKDKLKIFSPSKVTYQLGEFFGEGMAVGIKNRASVVAKAAGALAAKAADKLRGLKQQAAQIAEGVASAMTGALDVGALGGPLHASTPSASDVERAQIAVARAQERVSNPGEGASALDQQEAALALRDAESQLAAIQAQVAGGNQSVSDQLAQFASQSASFAQSLATAAAAGVNSGLIAQVAALGPMQGAMAAQALAAMDAAQVASANASMAAVEGFGNQLGQTVLTTTSLPDEIAKQQGILDTLKAIDAKLDGGGSITINVTGGADADAVVAAIRRYIKRNGKLRGVAATD
jgi:hypothetical protein